MLRQSLKFSYGVKPNVIFYRVLLYTRYKSSKPESLSPMDSFNKAKTEYKFDTNFGSIDLKTDSKNNLGSNGETPSTYTRKSLHDIEKHSLSDLNKIFGEDARLCGLDPNSPEYRDILNEMYCKHELNIQHHPKWYEFNERIWGVGVGMLLVLGIIAGHSLIVNSKYLKSKLMYKIRFKDQVANKARDMTESNYNTQNIDNRTTRLANELAQVSLATVKASEKTPGLYVCGSGNNSKLFTRIPFFDEKYIQDVVVAGDYVAAIVDDGTLYEYNPSAGGQPQKCNLPFKIKKISLSRGRIYGLTNKGQVVFIPQMGSNDPSVKISRGFWPWKREEYRYGVISGCPGPVSDFANGESHMLLLVRGKLYTCCTNSAEPNFGQYGLPTWSLFLLQKEIPENTAREMTLLNCPLVVKDNGSQTLGTRTFTSIACGKYHSVVLDSSGNVWTWGNNNHGQCGVGLSLKTITQHVPKMVFTVQDLKRVCADAVSAEDVMLPRHVYASDASSYINVGCASGKDMLLSFGNGVLGQLGANRYMHACPKLQLIKSFVELTEYDDTTKGLKPIGIKNVSVGNNHVLVTLDNAGDRKDVLAFGDNEFGQYGNGKQSKSCRPLNLPKLMEPQEVAQHDPKSVRRLVGRIQDVISHRLELLLHFKFSDGQTADQIIVAGTNSSALYYKRC